MADDELLYTFNKILLEKRDEIIEKCTEKLINLSEDKLKLASSLIQNL